MNATPRYPNFSICFDDTPPTCREHWTGFLERCRSSVLEVLIFISAMSHAAAKPFNACWRPDSKEASKIKSSVKSSRLILYLPVVTFIGLAELVHLVHVNYEKERWQNTPLPKTNTHMKWLWLFTICTNTNFGLTVLWQINSRSTLQSFSRGTRSYAFSSAKISFAYSQISKKFASEKIWSVVLRPIRKPYWPFSNFDSTIFRHFLLRHFA